METYQAEDDRRERVTKPKRETTREAFVKFCIKERDWGRFSAETAWIGSPYAAFFRSGMRYQARRTRRGRK